MTDKTLISSEVDFSKEGKQCGYLRLPHSVHRSAYGWIPVPVACIRNGDGPTTLLMAGNHGDEYEGQVLLSRLIRELEPAAVRGRLIVLPMANFPAAAAGRRTSPIDAGNLNRSFPGDPGGTPTEMIAHYIEEVLLPECDHFIDLHAGGSSLLYLPTVQAVINEDLSMSRRTWDALQAFDAPYSTVVPPPGESRMAECGALRKGVFALGGEMGGGGAVTPEVLRVAERSVLRILDHFGHLRTPPAAAAEAASTQVMIVKDEHYCYAGEPGVFEPLVELGDWVTAGQEAARIHATETPGRAPVTARFEADGLVVCKRQPARVIRGDCLFHLASKWEGRVV